MKKKKLAAMPRAESVLAPDIRRARGDVAYSERVELDATGRVTGSTWGDVIADQIHRLWKRHEISTTQYHAGRCLQSDAELGQVSIPSLLNPSRIAGGGNIEITTLGQGERVAAALIRFKSAVASLGPCAPLTVAVVVEGLSPSNVARSVGKAERDGIATLRLGLDALIEFYRIDEA